MNDIGYRYFQLTLFCGHQTRCLTTTCTPQIGMTVYCRACQRWVAIAQTVEITR